MYCIGSKPVSTDNRERYYFLSCSTLTFPWIQSFISGIYQLTILKLNCQVLREQNKRDKIR